MQRQQSSRGAHKRARQIRMDLESSFIIPEAKPERIKDNVYTLYDDDFSPSSKAIKDWVLESRDALISYFLRPVKKEEVLRKKLGFLDGLNYMATILLSELVSDQGVSLEEAIMDDIAQLVIVCPKCNGPIEPWE